MDPYANREETVALAELILSGQWPSGNGDINDAYRLAELVEAAHEWRQNGGSDPYSD